MAAAVLSTACAAGPAAGASTGGVLGEPLAMASGDLAPTAAPGQTITAITPDSGEEHGGPTVTGVVKDTGKDEGGELVTIEGTNLTGATAVRFGSANAGAFKVNSSASISAVSPAGAGTVDVTVTTPNGTSPGSPADTFTYAGLFCAEGHNPAISAVEPSSGVVGATVTIRGQAFFGVVCGDIGEHVDRVIFGASEAAIVSSHETSEESTITVVAPAERGTVGVRLEANDGATTNNRPPPLFNYVPPPKPAVTAVTPHSGEESGGTLVKIKGTGFTGATGVDFGATSATSVDVESETRMTVKSPPGRGVVNVTVTGPGGTSAETEADKFTYDGPYSCSPRESEYPVVTSVEPASGPAFGGNEVIIHGERFFVAVECEGEGDLELPLLNVFPVMRVFFGTTEATFAETTTKEEQQGIIRAIAPPGGGITDVRVETFTDSPIGAADQYTYLSGPAVTRVEPNAGPEVGGTAVTITGTNLTAATAVHFGSANATSFKVVSEDEITAVAPPGTGTVDVTVTNAEGTSATGASDDFTYLPRPSVTAVEPDHGPPAGGTRVTIRGHGFKDVSGVKFGTASATSVSVESESSMTVTAPAFGSGAQDSVWIYVTTPGGTSIGEEGSSEQVGFTYEPTVTEVEPHTGPSAGGTKVTIRGTAFEGELSGGPHKEIEIPTVQGVRFGSTAATSVKVVSETEITAVSPAGEGTVDVTVRTPFGTSPVVAGDQFTYKPGGLTAGHPELFANAVRAGGEGEAIAQLLYGGIDLTGASVPEGELECGSLALVSGWNSGAPTRMHGRILSWSAQGHAPNSEHPELGANCRGGGGASFITDERPLAGASASEATRGAQTVPWNLEAICVVHEGEKAIVIKIGVPTGASESKASCATAEAETTEAGAEVANGEGCYASSPAPQGCVNVLVADPALGLELSYGGTLRARMVNGVGNGLDQSRLILPGGAVDGLRCEAPAGCQAAGTLAGELKVQGYEAAQLIQEK